LRTVVPDGEKGKWTIPLSEARKQKSDCQVGDEIEEAVSQKKLGRIAAQTAKQVVIQRLKEAERDLIYESFATRVGDVVVGTVNRRERRNIFLLVDRAEVILPWKEQIPGERYRQGDRVRFLIFDVERNPRGPVIVASRSHPDFLKKLFEMEIPEISEHIVEIKKIVREPGARSKVAVVSKEARVDCVGTCVGLKGSRIQPIIRELNGERIDIIKWTDNLHQYVINSLSPAKVLSAVVDLKSREAEVIVADSMLSLSIGKEGQNVRLAAKLTECKIDIRSESRDRKLKEREQEFSSDEPLAGERFHDEKSPVKD
jgi:N utilization substance protein A